MNRFLLIAALATAVYFAFVPTRHAPDSHEIVGAHEVSRATRSSRDAILDDAFRHRASNVQLEGQGTVVKLLPDDTHGSRHQRFIVRLGSGHTLLVVHNIDLAQRIDALRTGDTVAFYGEYEWNPKGGVIHWTHHDPQGLHPAGWVRHDGRTYQ